MQQARSVLRAQEQQYGDGVVNDVGCGAAGAGPKCRSAVHCSKPMRPKAKQSNPRGDGSAAVESNREANSASQCPQRRVRNRNRASEGGGLGRRLYGVERAHTRRPDLIRSPARSYALSQFLSLSVSRRGGGGKRQAVW